MNAATTQLQPAVCATSYRVFHLMREAGENGGYTVAMKPRKDGRFNITLSQCKDSQRYDMQLGEKIAITRMKQGKFFVCDTSALIRTLASVYQGGEIVTRDLNTQLKVLAERWVRD